MKIIGSNSYSKTPKTNVMRKYTKRSERWFWKGEGGEDKFPYKVAQMRNKFKKCKAALTIKTQGCYIPIYSFTSALVSKTTHFCVKLAVVQKFIFGNILFQINHFSPNQAHFTDMTLNQVTRVTLDHS